MVEEVRGKKMRTGYKFKFYLNARHVAIIDGRASNIHPHTWELLINVGAKEDYTISFGEVEKEVQAYLANYEGSFLNEKEEFKDINPTMESIGKVLIPYIKDIISKKEMKFISMEISENPTRTYVIEE